MQRSAGQPSPSSARRYWRANLRLLFILLSVWFLFSAVLSIFLVEWLNQFRFAGFPLGFWIAQQGSILVFIALILVYALAMQRLDKTRHSQPPHKKVS